MINVSIFSNNVVANISGDQNSITFPDDNILLSLLQQIPSDCLIINNGTYKGKEEIIISWDPIDIVYLKDNIVHHINHIKETMENVLMEIVPEILNERKNLLIDLNVRAKSICEDYIGFYGYMGYETGRYIEVFNHRKDNSIIPDAILIFPSNYLIVRTDKIIHINIDNYSKVKYDFTVSKLEDHTKLVSNITIKQYLKKIDRIIEHIHAGDIYQVNFTQQFIMNIKDQSPRELYLDLIKKFKVKHHAYLEFNNFQILSISPELFIKIKNGKVFTKPIKGTINRGLNSEEDGKLAKKLLNSEKDNAELSMIVDLLRNDLGKSSLSGSVRVENHAILETFSNVHHLVSEIRSDIEKNPISSWNLILRAFPGGSITGVPKIRAMEIIDENEITTRGVYTGSIGYISINGNAEFNIAIRTILKIDDQIIFNAGGGIVADSDPVSEYIETLHKAKHIASFFGSSFTGMVSLFNNSLVMRDDTDKMKIHEYKDGFFETILVKNSKIVNFDSHRKRMEKGVEYFKLENTIIPNINNLNTLIRINLAIVARLKIAIFIVDNIVHRIVSILPYSLKKDPVNLLLRNIDDSFFDTILKQINAGIKPINYINYLSLTKEAIDQNCWDVLGVKNGLLTEGGRSNIYLNINNKWFTPQNNVVHGTIRAKLLVSNLVKVDNLEIDDLIRADAIVISNSLIGIIPVENILNLDKVWWKSKSMELSMEIIDKFNSLQFFKY